MSHISDARAQEIGELNQKIDELEEDLIQAGNQNQLQAQRIDELQAQLNAKIHENSDLQNQNLQLTEKANELQASDAALKNEIQRL
jgi:hypothetical protein